MIWIILLILFGWFFCGFLAFILVAKDAGWRKANKEVRSELVTCLILGVFALVVIVCIDYVGVGFDKFLNWLLKKINGEEKNE